ncbi:hypothetical protein CYMTET_35155 [Cymbomonas tetramitiformis]|uniref:Sm domain-containing protein n=1 Tax=Cymbomonas tetramitiformis TaxID=36881 RepID=A0AAE0KPG4_9CHLO|nr:hypothetical protein CYMTET_35155 [Cymbomonas tetramitiformis]
MWLSLWYPSDGYCLFEGVGDSSSACSIYVQCLGAFSPARGLVIDTHFMGYWHLVVNGDGHWNDLDDGMWLSLWYPSDGHCLLESSVDSSVVLRGEAEGYERMIVFSKFLNQSCPKLVASLLFDNLAAKSQTGPLKVLYDCYKAQKKVFVVTRHLRGVRGNCVGQLIAFDKYMNLILKDVDEKYTALISIERKVRDSEGKEHVRYARRQDHRSRHLGQIFIRGASIVLISQVSDTSE